jgi:hypothetical protein
LPPCLLRLLLVHLSRNLAHQLVFVILHAGRVHTRSAASYRRPWATRTA